MSQDTRAANERRASRMHDMIKKLGIRPSKFAQLDNDSIEQTKKQCLSCTHVQECLSWLDDEKRQPKEATFCPNLPLFRSLSSST